ncbi:MAG: circadian clock protein KaiC [Vulcanimicrobiota bacterium]
MSRRKCIEKLPTGIPGFDNISEGGLPQGRSTLLCGSTGSAKTTFALQFLAEGIQQFQQSGVMVTFEERPEDIRRNVESFGWDIEQWEREGKFCFVNASYHADHDAAVTGEYDLGGLLARLEHAVNKVGAKRLVMDSAAAVLMRLKNPAMIRAELFRIVSQLREWGITSLLTQEWPENELQRPSGAEEFVTDNVVVLRNLRSEEKRRRTIEILKFRGTTHHKGEYPFSVLPDRGVMVIPLSSLELTQSSSDERVSSGVERLDEMCGGGFFRDSIILVSGATGTGKTLLSTHFLGRAAQQGDKVMVFAFEESREQLLRNARGWGFDFRSLEKKGLIKLCCRFPETASLEDQLLYMRNEIEDFGPRRIAIDSLSALERVSSMKGFREFVLALSSFVKERGVPALFTSTTPLLTGATSVTEEHISSLTDTIILLRYVEICGKMRRGLAVLKMRGSAHDKVIHEYTITTHGMRIEQPFEGVFGILSGNLSQALSSGERL